MKDNLENKNTKEMIRLVNETQLGYPQTETKAEAFMKNIERDKL